MSLAMTAEMLDIPQPQSESLSNVDFTGVSIDTRSLVKGDLFIALQGPNFDGHDFAVAAAERGAAALLVARPCQSAVPELQVEDTYAALKRLASCWRERFDKPLVAVTGSNGKTTVKEMLAAIFSQNGEVLATRGNFNNEIGMPLTLLRLGEEHDYAIIEMGANAHGEIARLTQIARPDVALITNAGAAHLEGFGSLHGVAEAKGEIFEGLSDYGVAVLNVDDYHYMYWAERIKAGVRKVTFGMADSADVRASDIHSHIVDGDFVTRFQLHCLQGQQEIKIGLAGAHNVMNALSAIAVALSLNVGLDAIVLGLKGMKPVKGRLQPVAGMHDSQLINDSYNANPASLAAALDVLAACDAEQHWLALGDMGELGDDAVELHKGLGEKAKARGVSALFSCGPLGRHASDAFGEGGEHFSTQAALIESLQTRIDSNVVLLVKGSRLSKMENLVDALVGRVRH